LAVANISGLHWHFSHPHDPQKVEHDHAAKTAAAHDQDVLPGLSVGSGVAAHLAGHMLHGQVDADLPAAGLGHYSFLLSPLVLLGIAYALIVALLSRVVFLTHPPFRPPELRSRRFLLPPSHAPPAAV
jgi:hypothetical protein